MLVLGDTRTLDAVLRDPFLQPVDRPRVVRITVPPASQARFGFMPERVVLSPRAESVAAVTHGDDYSQVTTYLGRTGAALFSASLANLDCVVRHLLPGGDHSIVVGEVVRADSRAGAPLVYHRRQWGTFTPA